MAAWLKPKRIILPIAIITDVMIAGINPPNEAAITIAKWRKSAILSEFIWILNNIRILPRTPKKIPHNSLDDKGEEKRKGLSLNNTPIIEKEAIKSVAFEIKSLNM
jgi:hypothetical protein